MPDNRNSAMTPENMATPLILTAAVVAATIGLWATGKLPEYLTALLFFAVTMVLALAPPSVVFSGFASAAFWLVLSGYVIGLAIGKTGLAARMAGAFAGRLTASYPMMVLGVVALAYTLAFVMPSNMGRIALLMPIVLAMADSAGLGAGRPGRVGLALAVGFGTFQLSASILPANVPNLVMAGAIEANYGLHLAYLPYLMLHAPVLGILKGIMLWLLIVWLFRDQVSAPDTGVPATPWTSAEKRLAWLLMLTLGLWLTDSLHGIAPAWIGLSAACVCLLPGVGFVSGEAFGKEVNHRTAIYVAAILGLAALVGHSGLGDVIGQALLRIAPLDQQSPFTSFAAITSITAILNFVVTANGVPAIFSPLAESLAQASGLPLLTVLMIQVLGFATPLLPYQASPIVVAMGLGGIPFRAALRLGLALAAVTFVLLLPLQYVWFRALGWL